MLVEETLQPQTDFFSFHQIQSSSARWKPPRSCFDRVLVASPFAEFELEAGEVGGERGGKPLPFGGLGGRWGSYVFFFFFWGGRLEKAKGSKSLNFQGFEKRQNGDCLARVYSP